MAKLEKMTMEELVASEKAATIVRKSYEDRSAMFMKDSYYGGEITTMSEKEHKEYIEISQKLTAINAIRLNIMKEMEKRLLGL